MKRRYGLESIFYSRRVFILKISLIAAGAIILFLLCFFLVRFVRNKFFNIDSVTYVRISESRRHGSVDQGRQRLVNRPKKHSDITVTKQCRL